MNQEEEPMCPTCRATTALILGAPRQQPARAWDIGFNYDFGVTIREGETFDPLRT